MASDSLAASIARLQSFRPANADAAPGKDWARLVELVESTAALHSEATRRAAADAEELASLRAQVLVLRRAARVADERAGRSIVVAGGGGDDDEANAPAGGAGQAVLHFISSGRWAPLSALPRGAELRGFAAEVLRDGRVLIAGGSAPAELPSASVRADVFSPASGAWSVLPDLPRPVPRAAGISLSDGRFLVADAASPACFLLNWLTLVWTGGPPLPFAGAARLCLVGGRHCVASCSDGSQAQLMIDTGAPRWNLLALRSPIEPD